MNNEKVLKLLNSRNKDDILLAFHILIQEDLDTIWKFVDSYGAKSTTQQNNKIFDYVLYDFPKCKGPRFGVYHIKDRHRIYISNECIYIIDKDWSMIVYGHTEEIKND